VSEELDYGIGGGGVLERLIKIGAVEVDSGIGTTATFGE
jgi:hypothetical protein